MKKIIIFTCFLTSFIVITQNTAAQKSDRDTKREERKKRTNAIIKQEEEGVLYYTRQNAFGLELRTNGYGLFYELGRMKSPRFTNIYTIELTETLHPKEEKITKIDIGGFTLGNSFKRGKINNFYAAKLGFGQQYIFGQKGNKNGIAVIGSYQGGLALGLLKPYYVDITDNNVDRKIKYGPSAEDSALFLSNAVDGSSGFTTGWNELKIKPGAFVKAALRFDFGSYNESITAVEIGMSLEAYAQKIEQMALNDPKRLFFQAHIAVVFGSRK